MKRLKLRPRFQGAAGFYNFDALLLSFFLLFAAILVINGGSRWGLKWMEWAGAALFLFAAGLFLYLSFLRR
jgi:hypothetical protein